MSKKPHKLEHGHTITFDDAGHRYIKGDDYVIGMTTILKYLAAPALENWKINQLTEAMQNQMKEHLSLDVVDKIIINAKATLHKKQEGVLSIGKVVHKLAEQWLRKKKFKLPEDTVVLNCFRKFQQFWRKNKLKMIESERVLYFPRNEKKQLDHFCGTLDIIAKDSKNNLWIIDIKTSVGFFINMIYQLHGYKLAYEEQTGKKINKMYIVRLPKTDDDFEAREFTFQKQHQNAFLGLLHCHKSQLLFNEQSRKFKQSRLLKQRSKTNGKLK